MKLCSCPALHKDHNALRQHTDGVSGERHCPECSQTWADMRSPRPDHLGRFMDGSLVLHWRDGYVNLVDVSGEKLLAKRYHTPTAKQS